LARFDAHGVLHHVMGRGIERREIFQNDTDRQDFVDRLSQLAIKGALDTQYVLSFFGSDGKRRKRYLDYVKHRY